MQVRPEITERKDVFLEELFSLIRIPSVSAQPEHRADMDACAARWKEILMDSGADRAETIQGYGNPLVYAEKIIHPSARTVLLYGHYDVMPPEPLDLWKTDPFSPVLSEGMIWGRGADDDKGQSMAQVKAFETVLRSGRLRCNVKFLLEGEEEIGSPHLDAFLESHRDLLCADVVVASDTSMLGADMPGITTGLRGIAYWEVEVTAAERDLHSGIFGGAVPNPIHALSTMISRLIDQDGRITLPGFYDRVEMVSAEERDMMASIPHDDLVYRQSLGLQALTGEKGYSTLERTSIRPSLDVCGIWGGYTGQGVKTVLPSKAYAKISVRLVPFQDYKEISQMLEPFLASVAPPGVKVKVSPMHGGNPYVCPVDLPAYRVAARAYEKTFGKKPIALRRGGSIPVISSFEKVLGLKTILMGFGLESNAIHSPNEHFPLDLWLKSIETCACFYETYG